MNVLPIPMEESIPIHDGLIRETKKREWVSVTRTAATWTISQFRWRNTFQVPIERSETTAKHVLPIPDGEARPKSRWTDCYRQSKTSATNLSCHRGRSRTRTWNENELPTEPTQLAPTINDCMYGYHRHVPNHDESTCPMKFTRCEHNNTHIFPS